MRLRWRRIQLIVVNAMVCLGWVGVPRAGAQEAPKLPSLTLEQAVAMALEQNPAFRSNTDEAEAQRARFR